jgi:hypothetical protein
MLNLLRKFEMLLLQVSAQLFTYYFHIYFCSRCLFCVQLFASRLVECIAIPADTNYEFIGSQHNYFR